MYMNVMDNYTKIGVDINDINNGNLKFEDYLSMSPMFYTKDHATAPFINRFKGCSAFIVASGPSLGKIDKSKLALPGILTMGVNNSAKVVRPKIWTCVDPPDKFLYSVWKDPTIEKIVPFSHMDKKLFNSEKWCETNVRVSDCPNVYYYRRNGVMNPSNAHWLFENTVNWGNHSEIGGGRSVFITAVRMMFLFGVKNLFLVGADFNMDKNSKYAFAQDRNNGSINGNNATYSSMNKWFGDLRLHLEKFGMKVYNCNNQSKLTAFDFIGFDDAIKIALNDFPNIVNEKTEGMYTRTDDEEFDRKAKKAKEIAAKYTELDRSKIKQELQDATNELTKAKECTTNKALQLGLSEVQVKEMWNQYKNDNSKFPEYSELMLLRKLEENKRNIRKIKMEEKNRIFGIVKK